MEEDRSKSWPAQRVQTEVRRVRRLTYTISLSRRLLARSRGWHNAEPQKQKMRLGCAMIFTILLVLSCSASVMRSTRLGTTATPTSARSPIGTSPTPTFTSQTPTWTTINASFPGLADTTNNIHIALPFDFNTKPASMAGKVDLVWGTNWAGSLPGNMYSLFYLPYDRDEDTRYYAAAHGITWYRANHPDWIEYKCDRSTVAYEFGDGNSVPLDNTNPAVVSYIEETYLAVALRPGSGYKGVGFDNLDFENAGDWSGQRCGHYDANGNWIQQFNGTANDPAYRQTVLTWAQQMHTFIRAHYPNAMMAVNFSYDPNFSADSNALSNYVDFYIDEQGFTNGNNASPANPSAWYFTDAAWSGKINWIQNALRLGRGFFSINQEPVPFAQVTNDQVQWALANYLLVKNNASFVYICGEQEYGYLFLRPEYAAQVGSPVSAVYQDQGLYMRNFTNGVVIVNPSSSNTYTVQLLGTGYKDLYGNSLGAQVTLSAHLGLILIGA